MFLKYFITLSLTISFIQAEISLNDISSKPQSRAKNFMIWQFLKQDITPAEADAAYAQIQDKPTTKLLKAYAQKTNNKKIRLQVSCMQKNDLMSINNIECLEFAYEPEKSFYLTNAQRKTLSKKITTKEHLDILKIQSEPYSQASYEAYDPTVVLRMFIRAGKQNRQKSLNLLLDKEFMMRLSSSALISSFINVVVNDEKLDRLKKSLLHLNGKDLNSQDNFFLALNHVKHSNHQKAMHHLELSLASADKMIDQDKNYFWMYKVSGKKKYLNKLLLSKDINIYTLYAYEKEKKDFNHYFTSVDTNNQTPDKNIYDPFHWKDILDEIKSTPKEELFDLANSYRQREMAPVQTFILQSAHKYQKHGYIMPYDKHLKSLSNDEKALVYAIMRQESNLIPAALSRSYALGLMQLMPFLVDHISKDSKNKIDSYNDMFIPKNNIDYALKHIKWMKKSLYHPLFMAYAYNGGMGFFKRHLLKGYFNQGKHEPYLSIELMSNTESREYGKKVLANYVMYKKVMGERVSIVGLFDTLTQPNKTDRFRVQALALSQTY